MKKQIAESLQALGLTGSDFSNFEGLNDEFKFLRRQYLKKCLATHPDKGGDTQEFRNVNESFEFLKGLVEKELITTLATPAPQEYEFTYAQEPGAKMPSYEYYQEAAEHEMPPYRVEYAKSGRGKCFATKYKACGLPEEVVNIEKDQLRVGWLDEQTASYRGWCHVHCWRVPSRVWLGLPDPDQESDPQVFVQALLKIEGVSLCGFADLKPQDQLEFVKHVSDKSHWAAQRKPKGQKKKAAAPTAAETSVAMDLTTSTALVAAAPATASTALVKTKKKFEIPIPGRNGAVPNSLQGQTIVMTGVFPEVGGGSGLNLGKNEVKAMCQSFGARVTGSVSGKTTLLLVGKKPGMNKVQTAKQRNVPTTDLHNLCEVIYARVSLEQAKPATITDFSSGYMGRNGPNGLALRYDMAYLEDLKKPAPPATGTSNPPPPPHSNTKPPAKKAAKKKKAPPAAAAAAGKENSNPSTGATNSKKRKAATTAKSNKKSRTETAAADGADYSKMTVVLLRVALKERGLRQTGKKADLIARLEENDQPSAMDYSKMKVAALKLALKERGLKQSGRKADLIARLQEHDQEQGPQASQALAAVSRPPLQPKQQVQVPNPPTIMDLQVGSIPALP